jgi:hypothetical protein
MFNRNNRFLLENINNNNNIKNKKYKKLVNFN